MTSDLRLLKLKLELPRQVEVEVELEKTNHRETTATLDQIRGRFWNVLELLGASGTSFVG